VASARLCVNRGRLPGPYGVEPNLWYDRSFVGPVDGLPKGEAVKLHYYADTDSLYIEFKPGPGAETREVADGLNVDLDANGDVVGFDIDNAAKRLDLSTLETRALPVQTYRAG
jgi:uncharacterized protein YuzE